MIKIIESEENMTKKSFSLEELKNLKLEREEITVEDHETGEMKVAKQLHEQMLHVL